MRSVSDGREKRLRALEQTLALRAQELAVFLVYDRPWLVAERPGLATTRFAERCVSDAQIERIRDALCTAGIHVEVFEGDHEFVAALVDGHHRRVDRPIQMAYNGLGYTVGKGAFRPGRKSLIPVLADSYGLLCANSDAHACALTLHKFHSFTLLHALGLRVPMTWQYRLADGWASQAPPRETKVIVKSTYESWAVGVTEESVFIVDDSCDSRVLSIAKAIGQDVTVQQFISGPEVYVPVLSCPEPISTPPMESVLARSDGDPDAFVTIEDNLAENAVYYRPFDASNELIQRLCQSAREIFNLLQLQGLGRIDFRIDSDARPWVTDIAISPGLETEGSAAKSMAELGFDHQAFIRLAIGASLAAQGVIGGLAPPFDRGEPEAGA